MEICDVCPRDGLQNQSTPVAPVLRAELANRLAAAGLAAVEAVSFVRDDRVPAMAGAEAVVAGLVERPGTTFAGLVLNERGYERLRAAGLRRAHVTFAATEQFQQRNGGSSLEDGIARAEAVVERAGTDGIRTVATISCAFGCPYEGQVDPGVVFDLAGRIAASGADAVVLADTIGVAIPTEIRALVDRCRGALREAVGVHLHDTRGTALACLLAGLDAGATIVDASVGGIGGCPFAPGSQGNVATEDVVYLLERERIATGVDLDALIDTARWLESVLGHGLPGRVYRAGRWPPS